jgi:uncharacterized protein YndB with AHSA1/START domain
VRNFRISIDIDTPPERVWQVMSEVERWHEWTPSVTSIKRLSDGPLAVGSKLVIRQPKFPPALWKVKEIEPDKGFVSESVAPGLRTIARHFVEPTPTGSRATLSIELQGLLGGLFGRMTQDVTERYLALEAAGLKARSENPEFHHS